MNKQEALEQFEEAAYMNGGIYRQRIMASAKLAIATDPNNWPAVLASLRKWRPEFFSEKKARQRNETRTNELPEAVCLNRSRRFCGNTRSVEK